MNDSLYCIASSSREGNVFWLDSVDGMEVGAEERRESLAQLGISAVGRWKCEDLGR